LRSTNSSLSLPERPTHTIFDIPPAIASTIPVWKRNDQGTTFRRRCNLQRPSTTARAFARRERIGQDIDIALVRLKYRSGGPIIAKY